MTDSCSDPRFQKMIHAYELGLLLPTDLDDFEQHLMECEACAAQIEKMEDACRIINRDPEAAAAVDEVLVESADETHSEPSSELLPVRRRWLPYLSVSAAAVVLLFFLILKPWEIVIRTEVAAYADSRLTIMYFDNLADPADTSRLGEIAANLLITDLSESRYLQVLSSQRLYDILQLLRFDGLKTVSRDIATQVAEKAAAKWILQGSIVQTHPNLVITAQVTEVSSGNTIATQRVIGAQNESIINVVDRLSSEIKRDLPLAPDASRESSRSLVEMTTKSTECYRLYLQGVDFLNKAYTADARASFEAALRCDSTFAMAYYYLAMTSDTRLIYKAKQYSANATDKDRLYIDIYLANMAEDKPESARLLNELLSRYPEEKFAYFTYARIEHSRGHISKAIGLYHRAIELDSLYGPAYAYLIYLYAYANQYDVALQLADRYIQIAPGEANPYDTKADILVFQGRNEEAIQLYRQALAIKPDFATSLEKMGLLYLTDNDSAAADSCFAVEVKSNDRAHRRVAAFHYLQQGMFTLLLQTYDSALAIPGIRTDYLHRSKAMIYAGLHRWDDALREIQVAYAEHLVLFPKDSLAYRSELIEILAGKGDHVQATALLDMLREWLIVHEYSDAYYWKMAAELALSSDDPDSAIACLERLSDENRDITSRYLLGRAQLSKGDYDKAIPIFTDLTRSSPLLNADPFAAFNCEYYLALALESTQQHTEAKKYYSRFVDRWSNADPVTPELQDARSRLLALQRNS